MEQAAKTARETVVNNGAGIAGDRIQLDAPRFFVQMGWSALHVDTNGIPNRYLLRGEITPCRSYQCRTSINEIREGEKIAGSEEADQSGRIVWAKYWRHAYYEAERLIDCEGNATHKQGLFEVSALNSHAYLYDEVDFNKLFYPLGLHVLPDKNESLRADLKDRLDELKAKPPKDIPAYRLPIIYDVGAQLLGAVNLAISVQHARLQYTHSCMKLKPGEDGFKREYDQVDREMLLRNNMPEIHSAEIATALALGKLTDRETGNGSNDALLALVTELRESRKQNDELLRAFLGENKARK